MPPIHINRLTKRYGAVTAVDELSFVAREGAVTGFLGPNGAGKTTTLRMLLGLVGPTSGTATFGDRRYAELLEPARHVGAVLESTSFHPGRRATDHLRVLAAQARLPQRRVADVLDLVGLGDVGDRRVKGFSLGMRQRLGLAGALLGDPEVLILDEPANGLDPEGVHWLRTFVRSFADRGGTVIVSSHLLAEVAQTVDDVVIITRGRLVVHAPLEQLTHHSRAGVRIRTPHPDALRAALAGSDVAVELVGSDAVVALDTTPEVVGLAAAGAGIVIYEMSAEHLDLEALFLDLTAATAEVTR
jgi:ABC-2 type transport system ATP-binding protein